MTYQSSQPAGSNRATFWYAVQRVNGKLECAFSAVRKIRAVDNYLWHYMPDTSRAVHASRVCPGHAGRGDR